MPQQQNPTVINHVDNKMDSITVLIHEQYGMLADIQLDFCKAIYHKVHLLFVAQTLILHNVNIKNLSHTFMQFEAISGFKINLEKHIHPYGVVIIAVED